MGAASSESLECRWIYVMPELGHGSRKSLECRWMYGTLDVAGVDIDAAGVAMVTVACRMMQTAGQNASCPYVDCLSWKEDGDGRTDGLTHHRRHVPHTDPDAAAAGKTYM